VDDIGKAAAVVADMRKIIRQDPRIIQKLHRRVFIDKLTREQVIMLVQAMSHPCHLLLMSKTFALHCLLEQLV
jgi:hypothetical protein